MGMGSLIIRNKCRGDAIQTGFLPFSVKKACVIYYNGVSAGTGRRKRAMPGNSAENGEEALFIRRFSV